MRFLFRGSGERLHCFSSQALGARQEQQDSIALLSGSDPATALIVLADGAGGHRGGQLASREAVLTVRKIFENSGNRLSDPPTAFETMCREAHQAINRLTDDPKSAPRTTLVTLYIENLNAFWMNIGDSRLYRIRTGRVVERTKDHTMAQILLEQGEINEAEMSSHPDRVQLLRALGGNESSKPSQGSAELRTGDGFILCSDGFWENTSYEELGRFFSARPTQRSLDLLVQQAVAKNGPRSDNTSACVVAVG
jgi:serine/threonine protein phosphatase PrpC